jgi:hypothetical protein
VGAFFRDEDAAAGGATDRAGRQLGWADILQRLIEAGHANPWNYTPKAARAWLRAADRREREQLRQQAVIGRAAVADQAAFNKLLAQLDANP